MEIAFCTSSERKRRARCRAGCTPTSLANGVCTGSSWGNKMLTHGAGITAPLAAQASVTAVLRVTAILQERGAGAWHPTAGPRAPQNLGWGHWLLFEG